MTQSKKNYQRELDRILVGLDRQGRPDPHTGQASLHGMNGLDMPNASDGRVPTLLLHSCCAPCSSYVLEYLSHFFSITVFYYNPNIYPEEEYFRRVEEQKRLVSEMPLPRPVRFLEGYFDPSEFYEAVRGKEHIPEGGERCLACFRLRLDAAARLAAEQSFDYFTTTLTISPLKNASALNEIGETLAAEYGARWLPSDFKKRNGYKRSVELSAEYGLYRQDYCGCVFSKREREQAKSRLAETASQSTA